MEQEPIAHIQDAVNYAPSKMQNLKTWKKSVRFTPQSYSGNIDFNEIIRFIINTDGYWDPYNTYILMEIDTSEAASGTVQQVDGSAHSFINELIVTAQGKEIERVLEYDVLGNLLQDLNYSKGERDEKVHEGVGSWQNSQSTQDQRAQSQNFVVGENTIWKRTLKNRPFVGWSFSPAGKGTSTLNNPTADNALVENKFQFEGLPLSNILSGAEGDDKLYYLPFEERVDQASHDLIKYSPESVVDGYNLGVDQYNNEYFQVGSFEPSFDSRATKTQIVNGKLSQTGAITNQTFVVPLLSSIFGILLPPENYKYIPMKYLRDLQLEFRLNPYAMFTGGYSNDVGTGTQTTGDDLATTADRAKYSWFNSPTTQQIRKWKFKKFEIWTDVVYFPPEIDRAVEKQYMEQGLMIQTRGYTLGPLYQISSTAQASATWQVNLGFDSLQGIMIHYLLNDYQTYSFCRKNYRVSSNVTKLQAKFGVDYIPPLPIEGHGGQSFGTSTNNKTCVNYILHLQKLFGKLHDVSTHSSVNLYNFAVNERPYDVTKTGPFLSYDGTAAAGSQVTLNNNQTAIGWPKFFENQVVGKALYGINLQQLNHNVDNLAGINTTGVRPFELVIETDSSNVDSTKDRKRTMYIWCIHDYMLKITANDIMTFGRS